MKYIDRLNVTAEESAKKNNELVAEEASLNLQTEVLNTKRQIASAEQTLEAAKCARPFSAEKVYSAQNTIDLLKRKLDAYSQISKELF